MTQVTVKPELLRWACERSGIAPEKIRKKFRKLPQWEKGDTQPTIREMEAFAKFVHVSVGYLFLTKPPKAESVPIPDFRTIAGKAITRPSPDLLDTIYMCQNRQDWYRDFAKATDQLQLDFVGSASLNTPPEVAARLISETLGFDPVARRKLRTWKEARRQFIRQAEEIGILVMGSGIVKGNTKRPLNPKEFRGFALSDPLAPLIFINGKDTEAAQIFTLAHEIAHIWLGESALSNLGIVPKSGFRPEEVWCNAVAAELLVPKAAFLDDLKNEEELDDTLPRLARNFKVSTLVILRRLLDTKRISRARFDREWKKELERFEEIKRLKELETEKKKNIGGGFYNTTMARVGRRFIQALVVSTLEGQTLYRDAFRMLGISNADTFNKLGHEVGVIK